MNREARELPDAMITSAAPALAFLLYFCWWCHIISNLITSTVSVVTEKFQTSASTVLISLSLGQYGKASV